MEFLKRPEAEEQMYEEMHRQADGADSDEDAIIDSLEQGLRPADPLDALLNDLI